MMMFLPIEDTLKAMSLKLLGISPIPTIQVRYEGLPKQAYKQLDNGFSIAFQGRTLMLYPHRIYSSLKTKNTFMACTLRAVL
jgi:hypothetical protein